MKQPKLLSSREMEILRIATYLLGDQNGDPFEVNLQEITSRLSFKIDEDDIYEICENVSGGGSY